jgi:hypothetical protein
MFCAMVVLEMKMSASPRPRVVSDAKMKLVMTTAEHSIEKSRRTANKAIGIITAEGRGRIL